MMQARAVRAIRALTIAVVTAVMTMTIATPAAATDPAAQIAAVPANDNFGNAKLISSLPFTRTGISTTGATVQGPEPASDCAAFDHTVWYKFQPSQKTKVGFDTSGSDHGTVLDVYSGTTMASLSHVGCNEYGHYPNSDITFTAQAGTTYYIRVSGTEGTGGILDIRALRVTKPANDAAPNAKTISSLPFTQTLDVRGAGNVGEPTSPWCGMLEHTVWYRFTPSSDMTLKVDVLKSDMYQPAVAVFRGGSLTPLSCSSYGKLAFQAKAGVTYYFQAGGVGILTFKLSQVTSPANDAFVGATTIPTALPSHLTSSTGNATLQIGEAATSCGSPTTATLWYRYVAPATDRIVSIDTPGFSLTVYGGGPSFAALEWLACSSKGHLALRAEASQTYWIRVASVYGSFGSFTLDATNHTADAVINDDFSAASPIASVPFSGAMVDTRYATMQPGEPQPSCSYAPVSASVWYSYTTPASPTTNVLQVQTLDSDFDTVIAVYTGSPLSALTEVACNDETYEDTLDFQSRVSFKIAPSTTYRIQASGYRGDVGHLQLDVASVTPPANDDFANDGVLTLSSTPMLVDTRTATLEPDEPEPTCTNFGADAFIGATVWYSYAGAGSSVTIDPSGSAYDQITAVYTGSDLATLAQVQCGENGNVTFVAADGTQYWIQIGGYGGSSGDLQFTFDSP